MKPILLAVLLTSSVAVADNAPIGPDFVGRAPRPHIDRSLVASTAMNRIAPSDVVVFAHDSSDLIDSGYAQVDRTARWLKSHPRYRIVLEGHADAIGSSAHNEDLATRRVRIVRDRLRAWGIPGERIVEITYGDVNAATPVNINDRRVVMFASDQPIQQIVSTQMKSRGALAAAWVEGNGYLRVQNAASAPSRTVVGGR